MSANQDRHDPTFVLANQGWMKSIARGLVLDESRAEDVVQDACVALVKSPMPRGSGVKGSRGR